MKYSTLLLSVALCAGSYATAQNVGINTTAPLRSFHINSGSLLITGDTGTVPNLVAGAKFFWSPTKSAFRAGLTDATQWDYTNLGEYSFATGKNTTANGIYSAAGGFLSNTGGQSSFSFGNNVQVSGDYSAGFGSLNSITGTNSFIAGSGNNADGNYSVAFGRGSTANSYGSLVIGRWNKIETTASATNWVATDPLFVIGNGISNTVSGRRTAFSVAKNGDMEVAGDANLNGDASIAGATEIGGDAEITGATNLKALLSLAPKVVNATSATCGASFALTVGNTSYIRLSGPASCSPFPYPSAALSDGLKTGQILIIQIVAGAIRFQDSPTYNLQLASSYTLGTGSTIMLMWTSGIWTQVSVSDNL